MFGPWGFKKKVEATLSEMEERAQRNFTKKDIFIFGHSLGTACAQIYFNQGYAGMCQYTTTNTKKTFFCSKVRP